METKLNGPFALVERHVMVTDTRIEFRLGGRCLGVDYAKRGKPPKKKEVPPIKPVDKEAERKEEGPPPLLALPAQEKTYEVKGSQVTTMYSLRLEGLEVKGEGMEFTGTASGIFTASANPLQHARLRTKDLQALCSRGTLFFFDFRPTRFEVRFFDPNNLDTPLALLYADPVPPAGNPGSGCGKWIIPF